MKAFLKHFLGAGTEAEFSNFGFTHIAPILLAIGCILQIGRASCRERV